MALTIGSRLGHYEVTALIGEGGMGQVYQATDTKLKRQVALKILPEAFSADPERLARFQREAEVLASLNHPNIAAIYGLEEADGIRALVLELVEGPTLADRIKKGPIPIDEALPIAKQIAEALEAAHEAGVIHRDLKPANIKVREDGTVKVLDFGLAKALDPNPAGDPSQSPTLTAAATQMGVIMGTAAYMSPEQAAGKVVDKRGDIWSFGVVLFEMLTGQRLFTGETVSHVLGAVLQIEPQWDALPASTPAPLIRLLRRCLVKDRRRRLHDVADVWFELEEASSAESSGERRGVQTPRGIGRKVMLPTAIGILVGGVISALGVLSLRGPEPVAFPEVPREMSEFGNTIVLARDGRRMAYHGLGRTWWVRSLDGLESQQITAATQAEYFEFSPDGESVVFRTGGWVGELRVQSLAGEQFDMLSDAAGDRGIHWGSDGWIYFMTPGGVLARIPAQGGETEILSQLEAGEVAHSWPQLLPGGRYLLFTVMRGGFFDLEEHQLVVLNIETGERRPLVRGVYGRYTSSGHLIYASADSTLGAIAMEIDPPAVTGIAVTIVSDLSVMGGPRGADFSVTDTGMLAYVVHSDTLVDEAVWVSRDGETEPIDVDWGGRLGALAIAPDGARLSATIARDRQPLNIYTVDLTTGELQRLSFGNVLDVQAQWTADGSAILFNGPRPPERLNWDIYMKPIDGGAEVVIVDAEEDVGSPQLTRDGQWLIYNQDRGGTRDVLVIATDGDQTPVAIAATAADERFPAVSPDGRMVAYESDETGQFEIWVAFRDSPETRVQVSSNGGRFAKWGRNRSELYYVDGDSWMIAAAFADVGLAVERRQPLFSLEELGVRTSYDVTADGMRFAMIKQRQRHSSGQVVLVQNWFEELTRLVPTQ